MALNHTSPGIIVREFALDASVPAISTSEAGIAWVYNWGPMFEPTLVDSENVLRDRFGPPNSNNAEGWFSGANFLNYRAGALWVVRTGNTTSTNGQIGVGTAMAIGDSNVESVSNTLAYIVKNETHFESMTFTDADTDLVYYLAKWPGSRGNSLKVSQCDTAAQFQSNTDLSPNVHIDTANSVLTLSTGSNTATVTIYPSDASNATHAASANALGGATRALVSIGDEIEVGNAAIGQQYLKVTAIGALTNTANVYSFTLSLAQTNKLITNVSQGYLTRRWEYADLFNGAPGRSSWQLENGNTSANDEMHVVVADALGRFTGVPGTVLEKYGFVSRATDAKSLDNETNYYRTVINDQSQYLWHIEDRPNAVANTANNLASATTTTPMTLTLLGGADGADEVNVAIGIIATGYDMYASGEDVDVSFLIVPKARGGTNGEQLVNYINDNIAEPRHAQAEAVMVFASPDKADVVNNSGDEAVDIVSWANGVRDSSHIVMDSGYKNMYDRYNNVYRNVPLAGDVAGLTALTDALAAPWVSPAGYNRGRVRNFRSLVYNPRKADRDLLFKANVNPVVTFTDGTILFGDKTAQRKPGMMDAISIRRLFNVMEKAIAKAAKYTLFELNTPFTRAQFRNLVEPFLRGIKGRDGITEFEVLCDDTNNTPEIIARNEFVASVFVVPNYPIRGITLNFVGVPPTISISEVLGRQF